MARSAQVQDIESLKEFRLALLAFAEKATNAIGEAEAEVQRATMWLENEAVARWTSELRKRHTVVMKAKEDLRYKQIFKSPTGAKQSTVDEEKALSIALRRFAEAEEKMANVKKWIRQLHKESHMFRGSVQRLGTSVACDVPNAAAKISRMIAALEGYVALAAPNFGPAMEAGDGSGISRGSEAPAAGIKGLRALTPDAKAKDAAPPIGIDAVAAWSAGEFAGGDGAKIEALSAERQMPDLTTTLILATGVQTARRIYLERSAGAFPGDSGWYIGPTDAKAPSLVSIRVDELLAARPHFAGLLTLPAGTLIVIDTAGIAAILNEKDVDVFEKDA